MATVPVYVEAFPEREAILHPEGADIELPREKEEEIPSVSEGENTEEESPPAPKGVLPETLVSLRNLSISSMVQDDLA
jgi:hypothetical protein